MKRDRIRTVTLKTRFVWWLCQRCMGHLAHLRYSRLPETTEKFFEALSDGTPSYDDWKEIVGL